MPRRPDIAADLVQLMQQIGPVWKNDISGHAKLMMDRFAAILAHAPKDGVTVTRDVSYGDHPRQQLDIYSPDRGTDPRPALLYVHGGAFVDGARNRNAELYANIHYCFARHGIVGINIGYRLAGDARYPAATQDVATAVAWLRAHATALNVDTSRIFLMGHSAGAAHTGSYVYDKRFRPREGTGIAGHIVISGRVRADLRPDNPNAAKVEAYYGNDARFLEEVSPLSHVDANSIPTLVAWAEYENPLIDVYCAELVYRLAAAKGKTPPSLWLRTHNHTSIVAHLNTADDRLENAILQFIRNP